MPISGCVDKWLNQKFYITQQRKGTMTWMNPKVIVLIKKQSRYKKNAHLYVLFHLCKLWKTQTGPGKNKSVARQNGRKWGDRCSKGDEFIIILIAMELHGIHVSKLKKIMCLNVCQKYIKLFGGKIPM